MCLWGVKFVEAGEGSAMVLAIRSPASHGGRLEGPLGVDLTPGVILHNGCYSPLYGDVTVCLAYGLDYGFRV